MTNEYQDILDCLKRKDQMITKKSIESENYLRLLHRAMKLLDEQPGSSASLVALKKDYDQTINYHLAN